MRELTQRTGLRSALVLLIALGAALSLFSVATGISPLTAAGDLMAAIGFLTWGRAALTRRAWTRGVDGTFMPRWAAIMLIMGGLGFAAGFIASGYIALVR